MNPIKVFAGWGARRETPKQLARRLDDLLTLLHPISPAFQRWYHLVSEGDFRELRPGAAWLVNAVAAAVSTGDLGEPAPALGYLTVTSNALPTDSPRAGDCVVEITGGSTYINAATLRPIHFQDLDPTLLTYPIFKQIVLAFSQAFEPDWCRASHHSLWKNIKMSEYARDPVITPCWMIHLSPPLAARIAPWPGAVFERFADGSLFMAATEEPFDPDNPDHVAAAHRMFAMIDTLQDKLPPDQRR